MAEGTPSTSLPPALEDLRGAIDRIDDRLQDLLIERAALVEQVAGLKRAEHLSALRPGREAQMLRRLARRHRGRFPLPNLVRIWRELLGGTVAMQAEFAVAVYAGEAGSACWDLARDHYGSHTPMLAFHHASEVVRAVSDRRAAVGVLSLPGESEENLWWRHLGGAGEEAGPRVIARLPFSGWGNVRNHSGALAIAPFEPEPSGDDCSLLVLEAQAEVSRAALGRALARGGLNATPLAAAAETGRTAFLFEVEDALSARDPRITAALAPLEGAVERAIVLGIYARPLTPERLASAVQDRS